MKQKGFTLIELLAVILILGIIALIAIPVVNKIIDQSRKGAFETGVNNVVGAIEDSCQLQVLKDETITTTYMFIDGKVSPGLNIKGNLPTSGIATVDGSCNVTLNVATGRFTATKIASDDRITIEEDNTIYTVYANGTAVYFNPVTGLACTAGEAVSSTGTKTGCMKWYTFNDGGIFSSNINLILDHNTTALVAWDSAGSAIIGPTDVLTQLQTDTNSWSGVPTRSDSYSVNNGMVTYIINYTAYKARLITAGDIASITGNTSFNEEATTDASWFYFDTNTQTQTVSTIGESNYDWLFDYTNDCINYGCNIADASNYGYWTSTAVSGYSNRAWRVDRDGALDHDHIVDNASNNGVRPVITISKSSL